MKKLLLYLSAGALLFLSACGNDDDGPVTDPLDTELTAALEAAANGAGVSFFRLPESDDFSAIPQDVKNPITTEKVTLGRLLFHETGIGSKPKVAEGAITYSCASCHHAQAGFQAGVHQGIGEGGQGFGLAGEGRVPNPNYEADKIDVQPIRSPSALNIAYQTNILWNGQFGATNLNVGTEAQWTLGTPKAVNSLGFEGTETQAIAGMDVHRLAFANSLLQLDQDYVDMFAAAFPEVPVDDRYDNETAGLAIAAYERTMLANRAPFQQWLNGNQAALTDAQKRGAILFFDKARCYTCHTGPALATMEFHALGMGDLDQAGNTIVGVVDEATRRGRGGFTQNPNDNYKFKVPQLYNLKDSPFYGHGSTFTSVREVLEYKNNAVPENTAVPAGQLAAEFQPLGLSSDEIADLVAFIEEGLYDAELTRYLPSQLVSGNCFPNNDAISQTDLGCN